MTFRIFWMALCSVMVFGGSAAQADFATHRDAHLQDAHSADSEIAPQRREFAATNRPYSLLDDIIGDRLEPDMVEVEKHPLGAEGNPVRVLMPDGERAYLRRLRCENKRAPKFERLGSVSTLSPWGMIMDLYDVRCAKNKKGPKKFHIYMDMYHPDHKENRPVPGFKIARGR